MNNKNTFIYQGIEVKLTGRTATQNISSKRKNPDQLVEITSIDPELTWTKFVNYNSLYIIHIGA